MRLSRWRAIEVCRSPRLSKDLSLGLKRPSKTVPVEREAFDLAKIAHDHPAAKRLYVVGYDIAQVPVAVVEFVRNE